MTDRPLTENQRGCRDCGCTDNEAHKYSECFCRCHTRTDQPPVNKWPDNMGYGHGGEKVYI